MRRLADRLTSQTSLFPTGGEGEIRTRGTLTDTPVFKTGPFNHSGTSPVVFLKLAEREGFEPSVTLRPHTLSRRAD